MTHASITTDPRFDAFSAPNREVERWSETCFFGGWSPDSEVGVFTHAGRCPQDLDLWWAHTVLYLPRGKIAVDRTWGRGEDGLVAAGNLQIEQQHGGVFDVADEGHRSAHDLPAEVACLAAELDAAGHGLQVGELPRVAVEAHTAADF